MIQRYDLEHDTSSGDDHVMVERSDGEWMKVDEHDAEVKRLREQLAASAQGKAQERIEAERVKSRLLGMEDAISAFSDESLIAENKKLHEAIEEFWTKQCGKHACGCDEWPECTHTFHAAELRRIAMGAELAAYPAPVRGEASVVLDIAIAIRNAVNPQAQCWLDLDEETRNDYKSMATAAYHECRRAVLAERDAEWTRAIDEVWHPYLQESNGVDNFVRLVRARLAGAQKEKADGK